MRWLSFCGLFLTNELVERIITLIMEIFVNYTYETVHFVDLVWGMKPLLFALMWIILIVLFVVVILAIILICYCYKRRKARRGDRMSRESTRDLKDGEQDQGDEASSTEDKQSVLTFPLLLLLLLLLFLLLLLLPHSLPLSLLPSLHTPPPPALNDKLVIQSCNFDL